MTEISKPICVSFLLITTSLFFCFNSGCKPSPEKLEAQKAKIEQMVNTTFDDVAKLESEQKFAEAEQLISSALNNKSFAAYKDRLISRKSELLIRQDKIQEAEELILSYVKKEPSVTENALNDIFQYYYNNKQFDKSMAFSDKILNSGTTLPDTLLPKILSQRLAAAIGTENIETGKAALESIMTLIQDSSVAVKYIEPHVGDLLRKKKFAEATALSEHLQNSASSNDSYKNLASIINIQCVIGTQDWTKLKTVYAECIKQLPDADLSRLMRFVFVSLQKAKQNDLLKECAKTGISSASGKQKSIDFAARKWAETLFAENKKSLPSSIKELQATATSPNQIASIFDRFFYEIADDKALVKELCATGPDLISKCSDSNIANAMKVKILDGAFIIEDYDLAVSMLEKGIPGKDEAWHAMSLPKVKAHRAQAQNKPRDAVKYYREFMDCWKNSEKEEEFDPTSGIAYSKEWILARNANRIAGILDSIPDKAEADKVREEAKAYFKVAIEKAKDDEAALKLVTEEAGKLK